MTTYDHTELRKQYEAEAAFNPQAYLNWQTLTFLGQWVTLRGTPKFFEGSTYRHDPSKPPFVAPTMKEQAMHRAGEIYSDDVLISKQGINNVNVSVGDFGKSLVNVCKTLNRHKHADLLIAIAEGETNWQCQQYDLESGSTVIGSWLDCSVVQAGNMLLTGDGENVRIKSKTRTVEVPV
jgi:hypothetical protein